MSKSPGVDRNRPHFKPAAFQPAGFKPADFKPVKPGHHQPPNGHGPFFPDCFDDKPNKPGRPGRPNKPDRIEH
jgi:hypothetical protein